VEKTNQFEKLLVVEVEAISLCTCDSFCTKDCDCNKMLLQTTPKGEFNSSVVRYDKEVNCVGVTHNRKYLSLSSGG
jgi:hypothetical protein